MASDEMRGAQLFNESGDLGRVRIGRKTLITDVLICKSTGTLSIGDFCVLRGQICCNQEITIGSFTGVATNTMIIDNNTHALGVENWIRHRIRIAPGAIVTKDVPPFAIVGGNPAKLIRQQEPPEESVLKIAERLLREELKLERD